MLSIQNWQRCLKARALTTSSDLLLHRTLHIKKNTTRCPTLHLTVRFGFCILVVEELIYLKAQSSDRREKMAL